MKIGLIHDREQLNSQSFNSLIRQLKSKYSTTHPVYLFRNRVTGQEFEECQFPDYISRPFYKYRQRDLNLEESSRLVYQLIKNQQYEKVYIYGAGTHTEHLLNLWKQVDNQLPIVAILITAGDQTEFAGYPVIKVSEVVFDDNLKNLVVYSSQSFEHEMCTSFKAIHTEIDSVGLYNHMNMTLSGDAKTEYLNFFLAPDINQQDEIQNWIETIRPDVLVCTDKDVQELQIAKSAKASQIIRYNSYGLIDQIKSDEPVSSGSDKPKLLYIDQSQHNEIGHYYHYCKFVLSAAAENFKTYLACNQLLTIAIDHADYVFPIFRFDIWGKDLITLEIPSKQHSAGDFIHTVTSLISGLNLSENDVVFIPNISDYELIALQEMIEEIIPYQVTIKAFIRYGLSDQVDRIALMQGILDKYSKVQFFTDTREMQTLHSISSGIDVSLLPIPVVQSTTDITDRKQVTEKLTISYLGDARVEKGFHLLPKLIKDFYQNEANLLHKFEIHNYSNGDEKLVRITMQELQQLADVYPIQLHSTSLSNTEYEALIDRSDIFLCLYDPNVYQYRSSHVVTEALAYGKEVVVIKGSSPANLFSDDCPWVALDNEDILPKLEWMVNNRDQSRLLSEQYKKEYSEYCTGDNLVKQLMDR